MNYYKIIQDNTVTGVGTNFLKWYPRTSRLGLCDMQVAQCVKDEITDIVYHAEWLKRVPDEAGLNIPEAVVELIEAAEYDELYEQLYDGETIPMPEPEPEPEPTPEPEPKPEHRMTVQEMRDAIASLTSMTAKDDITKGSYFVLHDEIYLAVYAILKGTEIQPGYNCEKITLSDIIQ